MQVTAPTPTPTPKKRGPKPSKPRGLSLAEELGIDSSEEEEDYMKVDEEPLSTGDDELKAYLALPQVACAAYPVCCW